MTSHEWDAHQDSLPDDYDEQMLREQEEQERSEDEEG